MRKTFSYKLYNNKRNKYLHSKIDAAASIWNHCINLHRRYYRIYKKHLHKFELQKHLAKIKHLHPNWNQVGSQAIQDITDRIDKGYQRFFKWCKTKSGPKARPPKFKKAKNYKSITLKQSGYALIADNQIRIGKRIFKFFNSRIVKGKIKTLTIKRDSLGDIYLYFSCDLSALPKDHFDDVENVENDSEIKAATGKSAGFDFGMKTFLTCSDGNEFISPEFFKQSLKNVQKANKKFSKKKKGSNNRNRARLVLACQHKKIMNQRNNFHWQLANKLANDYEYLFFETLNLEGMKKLWGRKVSDLGFGNFLQILKYKCSQNNSHLCFIDKWYPSSKLCNLCGCINENLNLKDREWECMDCKAIHNRDANASQNILREGLRALAGVGTSTLSVETIRQPLAASFV